MKGKVSKGFAGIAVFFVIAILAGGIVSYYAYQVNPNPVTASKLSRFGSCGALANSLKEAQQKAQSYYLTRGGMMLETMTAASQVAGATKTTSESGVAYSETNVQVEGVDEADIVKTDGEYIYTLTGRNYYYGGGGSNSALVIAKAYPSDEAVVLSQTDLGDFYPQEMFIQGDNILVFGQTSRQIPYEEQPGAKGEAAKQGVAPEYYPYPYRYLSLATVRIWDASDKVNPSLIRSVDFEGSYLSSRKIGSHVYFVVDSYPNYAVMENVAKGGAVTDSIAEQILPAFRDRKMNDFVREDANFSSSCGCGDVEYFDPVNPQSFITVASISMEDPQADVTKEVIMGSGQNVYASLSNLYIAEANYPFWMEGGGTTEKTIVHKFSLENGKITHIGQMEAPGHILNQFSMDEYNDHFRIATTAGRLFRGAMGIQGGTSNNVYIFGSDLKMTGKIENIAPGESIYSARFMGARGYMVTFKKVDPFFVLDLSNPANPTILGKLKIPGYSDYLHPYDENHIIGIGKEAVEAESEGGQPANFAWYQGVKIALFDVTDVANPKELHKVVIGDRGTDSYALHDHKAFLFDRDKNLLVVPILLAQLTDEQKQEKSPQWPPYGEYTFQGAYVYDLSLDNGFVFKGRITHYDDNQTFLKSGYYYFGDEYSVKRSLYIGDVLYTVSGMKIKLNSLADLSEIKQLVFGPAGGK
jgi:uncharacterized secreted protein with C-terminal beta-propeller domain